LKKVCGSEKNRFRSFDALQQRYNKAKKDNHKSFRYSLRLRIAVVDGLMRADCQAIKKLIQSSL
jgi:hypothetical protein